MQQVSGAADRGRRRRSGRSRWGRREIGGYFGIGVGVHHRLFAGLLVAAGGAQAGLLGRRLETGGIEGGGDHQGLDRGRVGGLPQQYLQWGKNG